MAIVPAVAKEEWAALHQAAAEFKALEAWNWMNDGNLFAVLNPEKNEVGYCCVLGMRGEVFALVVYLGSEGLAVHKRMRGGLDAFADDSELTLIYRCLMASFEDREALEKEDKAIIKSLGLKFKGRAAWPMFRSYQPNCAPWFLDSAEARFLAVTLRQSVIVAQRFKENPKLLVPLKEGQVFLRFPDMEDSGVEWQDRWVEPEPWEEPKQMPPPINELKMALIKKEIPKQAGIWELVLMTLPMAVKDGERPYYPRFLLCAEQQSGFIHCGNILDPWKCFVQLPDKLVIAMEKAKLIPKEIWVQQSELVELLHPFLSRLNISIVQKPSLRAIVRVKESLQPVLDWILRVDAE